MDRGFPRDNVLQFMFGKNEGTPVTAPQQLNRSEETCGSGFKLTHQCLIIPEINLTDKTVPVKHFRLSVADDSNPSQLKVCSPSVAPAHCESSHVNNVCDKMKDSSFISPFQECTKKTVDLVFLFDGSASMTEDEFTQNKVFIVDVMNSLKNSSIKFAAVQFATEHRKVFDFKDYEAGRAHDKLMEEPHMKKLTYTHRALTFVMDEILENPDAGASPDATKVVVLITDGDPSDVDRNNIIKSYDDKNIIRFVIGVKYAAMDKYQAIVSEPPQKYAFKIENYYRLTLSDEISQSGLRDIFYKVCSSSTVCEYNENYINSVCYKIPDDLHQASSFTPDFQECTKKTVDLVFLFDGSASMTEDEFTQNKVFIVDIMNSFKNSSIKFAAVQFATEHRKVFDFKDYEAGRAHENLMEEPHMKKLTNTHAALTFVMDEILENPDAGASPDATKVLVLITDGDPSDVDRNNIIKRYDDKNIIRFVIGVKLATLDKFRAIASEPSEKYAFKIQHYNGLTDILENFQKKIFNMEGFSVAGAGDLTGEMSGFSVVYYKGSIGSNSWQGSNSWHNFLQELHEPTHTDTCMLNDSYIECTKKTVDLVFLFDGSASMTEDEFTQNKVFIVDVMNSLKNSSIKFAAVQFATEHRKVFDFKDYEAGRAHENLMDEPHMKKLTNTHAALTFVMDEILENPDAGASPDATKVLVLITDGDPSDVDRNNIIKRYDDKNIIRFVIGVKVATLDKFRAIASEPSEKYAFKIQHYNGLTDILENFQKKIFNMEGFSVAGAGDLTGEMSGFSVVYYKGSIGSNSWQGSNSWHNFLQELHEPTHTDTCMLNDSYIECTKKTVDLVFLFDGSASMTEDEFTQNKVFIVDVMNSLKNSSIKFAAVQFATEHRKVFDFKDYEAGRAHENLMDEPHMKKLTNTHAALTFVMDEILENPDAGASPDATKVLVLITDGDPSDVDRNNIIKRYDDKNIIRFVIGVKVATLDKFRAIASEPSEKYAFKIQHYNGLTDILENFQKKIFNMEGYSLSVGQKNNAYLYFMGAPSFELRGLVIFYRHDCKCWTVAQRLTGDEIGSYFGAELCSVDINSDGNTDFLLVGAPLFYHPQEKREGQIYVYTLTDEMQLRSQLNVTVPSMGRFGTTISSLADLNGDGLRDVAVGAPLEDDNRGAVYIYLGDRNNGIRGSFSQRIMGQNINPRLRFFGQAITGETGEDGLPRIVIGSRVGAVVLRSRPACNVFVKLSIEPEEIRAENIDCREDRDENVPVVTLTTCFDMVETTRSKAGMISGLKISYSVDLDPSTPISRAVFNSTGIKSRNVTAVCELRDRETCFTYPIYMLKCVEDTSSPISIILRYFQVDTEHAEAVLNVDSSRQAAVEVPFKM